MYARSSYEQKKISKKMPLVKKGSSQEQEEQEIFDFIDDLFKYAGRHKGKKYTFSRENVQALKKYIQKMRTPLSFAKLTKSFILLKNNRQKLKEYKLDTILLNAAKKMIGKIENNERVLPNIIWSLAKLGFKKTDFDQRFIAILFESIRGGNGSRLNEQGISNTLWGLATSGFKAHDLATIKKSLFSAIITNDDQLDPQQIANTLWALATLGFHADDLATIKKRLFSAIARNSDKFIEQDIGNTLWALATLGFETHDLATIKEGLFLAIVENRDQFSAQSIETTLWALTTLGFQWRDLATLQSVLFSAIVRNKDQLTAESIANILWSFMKLGVERNNGAGYELAKQLLDIARSLPASERIEKDCRQFLIVAHYFNIRDPADFFEELERELEQPAPSDIQTKFFHSFQQQLSSEWYRVKMEVLIIGYFVDILISRKIKLPDGTTTEIHMVVEVDGPIHLEAKKKQIDNARDLLLKEKSDIIDIIRIPLADEKEDMSDSEVAQRVKEILLSPRFKKYSLVVTTTEEKEARKEVLDQKTVVSSVEAAPKKIEEKTTEKRAIKDKQDQTQTLAVLSKEKEEDKNKLETKTGERQISEKSTVTAEPVVPVSKLSGRAKPFVPVYPHPVLTPLAPPAPVLMQYSAVIPILPVSQRLSFFGQGKDSSCPAVFVLVPAGYKKSE